MPNAPDNAFPGLPPIAVAMGGLEGAAIGLGDVPPGGERVRAMIAWLAGTGARAVRLDATMAGIRPRELDRSGRRDLGALLRRSELGFAGLDAFIPPEHFLKPETVDRAVSSVLAAIDLAADLASLASGAVAMRLSAGGPNSVSIVLPEKTPEDIRRSIGDHAAHSGVRIADHAWPILEESAGSEPGPICVGLDPAIVLSAGADPVALAARLGPRLACARLSDIGKSAAVGGGRVPPGAGHLDVMAYLVTLATCGYVGHVVLDTHGLRDPAAAVRETLGRATLTRG